MDTADPNHLKALDSALADIFRQRKEKADDKKDKQAEREAMHHLKLRVLDLFVIFLKEQPTNGKIIVSIYFWLVSRASVKHSLCDLRALGLIL